MAAWDDLAIHREESPDSIRKQRCRVTPGRGNPTESATENTPPRWSGSGRTGGVKAHRAPGNRGGTASPTGSNAK